MTRFDRHSFAVLAEAPEPQVCGGDLAEVETWRLAGLPFVVASAHPGDPADTVRLGLAMPDKRRIGFRARAGAIKVVLPPPCLDEAGAHAPPDWRRAVEAVRASCAAAGIEARVFGSLAWTCRTSRNYLHDGSDLDLHLTPRADADPVRVRAAVAELMEPADGLPRLDGELILSDRSAVNLRELAGGPPHILVKAHGGARLFPLCEVVARIGDVAR